MKKFIPAIICGIMGLFLLIVAIVIPAMDEVYGVSIFLFFMLGMAIIVFALAAIMALLIKFHTNPKDKDKKE